MESQKLVQYLERSLKNDKKEIENHKKKVIEELQGLTKNDVIPKPKKLTLWQRIKKTLNF
jgi:F0F1-type ATP synthase membrane subunit b/b'